LTNHRNPVVDALLDEYLELHTNGNGAR
jgi:hypothetical protein